MNHTIYKRKFNLPANHANNRSWLDSKKPSVQSYIAKNGSRLADPNQTESVYFEMSSHLHNELKESTPELVEMFGKATEHVLNNPKYWHYFGFPDIYWDLATKSFKKGDKPISGRLDYSITPDNGIKCYEYNADSASCLMECGYTQGAWSDALALGSVGKNAGAETAHTIADTWRKTLPPLTTVHFLHDDDEEERYHTLYMMQLAERAGMKCKEVINFNGYTFNNKGEIVDDEGQVVQHVWKTWSYITLLDKLRDANYHLHQSGNVRLIDLCFHHEIQVFEPIWTAIASNKAILPVLWELYPHHPYLLESTFELTNELRTIGYASKPVSGRCGENVTLHFPSTDMNTDHDHWNDYYETETVTEVKASDGRFGNDNMIYQELCSLPKCGDSYVQVNTFTTGSNGKYAGTVTRVDNTPIVGLESGTYALRIV